ncbi:unnamed protein product [Lampetra planeri]
MTQIDSELMSESGLPRGGSCSSAASCAIRQIGFLDTWDDACRGVLRAFRNAPLPSPPPLHVSARAASDETAVASLAVATRSDWQSGSGGGERRDEPGSGRAMAEGGQQGWAWATRGTA